MSDHKFTVGQKVSFSSRLFVSAAPGVYEIVRLLPDREGQFEYRIKSDQERHERVAAEHQLSLSSSAFDD